MNRKRIKQKAITIFFKLLVTLLQSIPRKKRRYIISKIGRVLLRCSKKTQKRAIKNIQNAMPTLSTKAAKSLAFSAYGNCAFGVAESFWLDKLEPEIYCDEQTLELLQSGEGACIATMHIGSYEAVPLAVTKLAHSASTLTNVPTFIENGLELYEKAEITAIDKKSSHAFIKLLTQVKENKHVVLHSDLWGNEIDLSFFNQKTKAPAGVALLSIMAKKPLLLGYAIYDESCNIKVYFETVYKDPCEQKLSPEEMMKTVYQRYEHIIMQYPEQWYWSFKRWRI
jgi:KDO2-lipid IV(A) lauroyltransferase